MKKIMCLVGLIAFISACKKKEVAPDPHASLSYYMMKPGNFWIYEVFKIEADGSEQSIQKFDSCYIEKDTLIQGNTFHILVKPSSLGFGASRIPFRDSSGYLIRENGKRYFNFNSYDEVLDQYYLTTTITDLNGQPIPDTIAFTDERMQEASTKIVPFAEMLTRSMRIRYTMYPKYAATLPVRDMHFYYALGVGMVAETLPFFLSQTYVYERRLVRYYVQ